MKIMFYIKMLLVGVTVSLANIPFTYASDSVQSIILDTLKSGGTDDSFCPRLRQAIYSTQEFSGTVPTSCNTAIDRACSEIINSKDPANFSMSKIIKISEKIASCSDKKAKKETNCSFSPNHPDCKFYKISKAEESDNVDNLIQSSKGLSKKQLTKLLFEHSKYNDRNRFLVHLIENGADLNAEYYRPLFNVRSAATLDLLLRYGANLNLDYPRRSGVNHTALEYMFSEANAELIDFLATNKRELIRRNLKNLFNISLSTALTREDFDSVVTLIKNDLYITPRNKKEGLALVPILAISDRNDLVSEILGNGQVGGNTIFQMFSWQDNPNPALIQKVINKFNVDYREYFDPGYGKWRRNIDIVDSISVVDMLIQKRIPLQDALGVSALEDKSLHALYQIREVGFVLKNAPILILFFAVLVGVVLFFLLKNRMLWRFAFMASYAFLFAGLFIASAFVSFGILGDEPYVSYYFATFSMLIPIFTSAISYKIARRQWQRDSTD